MVRRLSTLVLWLAVLAVPRWAGAQVTAAAGFTPPDDTQSITPSAVIYTNYTFQQNPKVTDGNGNTISKNSFDDARAYVTLNGKLSHIVAFRITADISRETNATPSLSGSLLFRLKYGFMQLNLDDWMGQWNGSWVRVGIQQTPLIDYYEGIYRYRFQGTTFPERVGLLTSSDAGVSFHANLPNNMGEFHVGVYNGEGYSKAEASNQKAVQVRGTLRPFGRGSILARGLRVTGFYDKDAYNAGNPRTRGIFSATFEHKYFNTGVDYVQAKDQATNAASLNKEKGASFWFTPFLKGTKGVGPEVLVRYDWFKNNIGLAAQTISKRLIAGFAYWFPHPGGNATAAALVDVDQVKLTGAATVTSIALHALINF